MAELTKSKVSEVSNKCFVNIAESLDLPNIREKEPLNDHVGDIMEHNQASLN